MDREGVRTRNKSRIEISETDSERNSPQEQMSVIDNADKNDSSTNTQTEEHMINDIQLHESLQLPQAGTSDGNIQTVHQDQAFYSYTTGSSGNTRNSQNRDDEVLYTQAVTHNEMQKAMQDMHLKVARFEQSMQNKVSKLEMTLATATTEIKQALLNHAHSQSNNHADMHNQSNNHAHSITSGTLQSGHTAVNSQPQTNYTSTDSNVTQTYFRSSDKRTNPKLPPFNGKETWEVWFNRFQDIAHRQNWSVDERLDELLPKLQGVAGDFVYGQLPTAVRSNYHSLCKELSSRFRVIETSKTFWMKFTNRNQCEGESAEDYAADLKRLYDKSHSNRDSQTRQEDLLRKYLDGLRDDKARFHVEFVKEPINIDQAVFHTVCFQETKLRAAKRQTDYCDVRQTEDQETDLTYARAVPGKNKHRVIKHDKTTSTSQCTQTATETLDAKKITDIIRAELQSLKNNSDINSNIPRYHMNRNKPNHRNNQHAQNMPPTRGCFLCGDLSHFKRQCPNLPKFQESRTNEKNARHLN